MYTHSIFEDPEITHSLFIFVTTEKLILGSSEFHPFFTPLRVEIEKFSSCKLLLP